MATMGGQGAFTMADITETLLAMSYVHKVRCDDLRYDFQYDESKRQIEVAYEFTTGIPHFSGTIQIPFHLPDQTQASRVTRRAMNIFSARLGDAIRTHLRNRDFKSPTAICDACQRKEWLKPFNLDGEDFYSSIRIGSITYEFPARGERFESGP
jgi:hypothetical protein